jgi:ketosteroid isomerase-like protein
VPHQFYSAFAARDWKTMGALYADDARFTDPAFTDLDAGEVRAMWRMLISRGKDLAVIFEVLRDTPTEAHTRWTATYTFSQTGRKVVNVITATMQLRDGKIVRHTDVFDFHGWASQALGPVGMLLGGSGWLRGKVQGKAMASLRDFMSKSGSQGPS